MAESVVGFLLNKLASLTQEEVQLLRGIDQGIDDIRQELQQMMTFLQTVEVNPDPSPHLTAWADQVRQVAHDTEDVLDDYLRFKFAHRGDSQIIKNLLYPVKNWRARRQIGAEMQRIKSEVIKIFDRHQRYQLDQGSHLSDAAANKQIWQDRRGDALLKAEEELVGIEKPKAKLLRWILQGGSGLKVVSVVGMGGLGKTTLARKVYDEVKLQFQLHAKISVSQSFTMKELLKDVVQQVYEELDRPTPQAVESMHEGGLKKTVLNLLQDKKYLILLDDVWDVNAWNALKIVLPDSGCSSRVLLTTRRTDVGSLASKELHYQLDPLSPEDSWSLFCRRAFWGSPNCPEHLERVSRRIVKRCGGMPLAIVAISGVLTVRDTSNVDEWEKIYRSLGAELGCDDGLLTMKKVLELSYTDLPYYLKNCFLYMSVFPEHHFIESMRLIRLWVAEGFVVEKQNLISEEVAESYLNELVSRNLVQVVQSRWDGRVRKVRIHDILREIALSKSKGQDFLAVVVGKPSNSEWPIKIRRLSIHDDSLPNFQLHRKLPKLRSLLMFGEMNSMSQISVHRLLSCGCRLLRVLDLGGAPLYKFPPEIFELYHLRYLSLRNTRVKVVPKSIQKLPNLETLDLKHTLVTELPIEISKLQQLRHLLVGGRFSSVAGFKAPIGIGALQSLQKLCYVEVNGPKNGTIHEIVRLTQLRKLGILELRRDDGKALSSTLAQLSNLRSLRVVSAVKGDETIDLENLTSPPQFLQRLYLDGSLNNLPKWISSLQALVTVCLSKSKLRDDQLQSLNALPTLRELLLDRAYVGEALCFKARGFKTLKVLCLCNLEGLKRVEYEEGSMPFLEDLRILHCGLLKEALAGFEHLTRLKFLVFGQTPNDMITTILQQQGGQIAQGETFYAFSRINGSWIRKKLRFVMLDE